MTTKKTIKLGTRGSPLALWQAYHVRDALAKRFPELALELVEIKTTGDVDLTTALPQIGAEGLFTKQIEEALFQKHIDVAVHSLKDLPTALPRGLMLGAVTKRTHGGDALLSKTGAPFCQLPDGATIATGSLRRKAQLLHARPDLDIVGVRGNVNTRLRKYEDSDWDGMILAEAGLVRLEMQERITEILPHEVMLPAVGQGALGIEIREDDDTTRGYVAELADADTTTSTTAERAFLARLQGGCQVPIAARGDVMNGKLVFLGLLSSLDGKKLLRAEATGSPSDAAELGREMAEDILSRGGGVILEAIRAES